MLHAANLLFRMLELDVIWGAFLREINAIEWKNAETAANIVQSIDFAFDNLCIFDDSSAMIQVHILINCILRKLFDRSLEMHPSTVDAFLGLCIKLVKRLVVPNLEVANIGKENEMDQICLDLSENLLNGHIDISAIDPFSVIKILISSAKLITINANQIIEFSDPSKVRMEIFIKSSILLLSIMEKCKGIHGENLEIDFGFNCWFEKLLLELEKCNDVDVIHTFLIQINESSAYWRANYANVRSSLIGKSLPFLWEQFNICNSEHLCFIISHICRILPNESDIFFAEVLATAIRNRQFEIIENFTRFWDFTITSQFLVDIPFRISVLILVDFMTKNEFKFRKCSTAWIFSISKYLDRFLTPAISSFIDILECGMNDSSNSASSSKKCFRKNFDKGPLIYYLNIIERLLEVNYENILNYLIITEVDQYLMIQMCAFVDMIKKHLNIDFDFDFSKYLLFNLFLLIF